MTDTRDVLIVLLGDVLLRMQMNTKMTVGQAADTLLKLLEREGYVVISKQDLRRAVETAAGSAMLSTTMVENLRAEIKLLRDGNRPLPFSRDELGRMVREAWIRWAKEQPNPKPSWLTPYEGLSESDKEADRQIGEAIARWTLVGDAPRRADA